MENTKNLKTKVLALVLTVLMVVGVLPMSVFSVEPVSKDPIPATAAANDISELIDGFYGDPDTWVEIPLKKAQSFGTNGAINSGGKISLSGKNHRYHWGGFGKISFTGTDTKETWVQGVAGLDSAFEADVVIDSAMSDTAAGISTIGFGFGTGAGVRSVDAIRIYADGKGNYSMHLPNGAPSAASTYTADNLGTKICDLTKGKPVKVRVIYDSAPEDSVGYGRYYIYIGGEYRGTVSAKDGESQSGYGPHHQVAAQKSWNTTDSTSHPVGSVILSVSFTNSANDTFGNLKWSASNVKQYYFDGDKDGDYKDEDRAAKIAYYNDFGGSELEETEISVGHYIDGRNGDHKVVDGADRIALTVSGSNANLALNIYPQNRENANKYPYPANSGRSFVYQHDVKLGDVIVSGALVELTCTLEDNTFTKISVKPIQVTSTGALTYKEKEVGQLSKTEYTTVSYEVDVPNNKISVYIDGIKVVDGEEFLTKAQRDTLNSDTYKTKFPNGFALNCASTYMEQRNNTANAEEVAYYIDNTVLYYQNKCVVKNYEISTGEKYNDGVSSLRFDAAGMISNAYKTDSSNWEQVKLTVSNSRAGGQDYKQTTNTHTLGGETFLMNLGWDSDKSGEGSSVITALFNKNKAGLDVAMDLKITIAEAATDSQGIRISAWATTGDEGKNNTGAQYTLAALVPVSGTSNYRLCFPKYASPTATSSESSTANATGGEAITDAKGNYIEVAKGEEIHLAFLIDANASAAERYYVFYENANGDMEYLGTNLLFKNANAKLTSMQLTYQQTWDDADTANNYAHGFLFGGIRYNKINNLAVAPATCVSKAYYYTGGEAITATTPERKVNVVDPVSSNYNTNASAWQRIDLNISRSGKWNNSTSALTIKDETFLMAGATGEGGNIKSTIFEKNYAGLDVAVDMTLATQSDFVAGGHVQVSLWTVDIRNKLENGNEVGDGKISNGWQNAVLFIKDLENGTFGFYWKKAGTNGIDLNNPVKDSEGNNVTVAAGTYFNLRILLDADSSTGENVYVYINGEFVGTDKLLSNNSSGHTNLQALQIDKQNSWDTEGTYARGYMFSGVRFNRSSDGTHIMGTLDAYYYTDGQTITATKPARTVNVPELRKIIHSNDFENATVGTNDKGTVITGDVGTGTISESSMVIIEEADGNKAICQTNSSAYYNVSPNFKSADSFVMSADFKRRSTSSSWTGLLGVTFTDSYCGFTFVSVKNNDIYVNLANDGYASFRPYEDPTNRYAGSIKVGTLYADEYTNIAVAVDIEKNKFYVYINGVATNADGYNFFNETTGYTFEPNGRNIHYSSVSNMKFHYTRFTTCGMYYLDNVAIYTGNTLANPNANPFNGPMTDGDKVYIYKDGVRATGVVTIGDNTYIADENSIALIGKQIVDGKIWDIDAETYIATMRKGIMVFDQGTAEERTELYADGVLQTGKFVYKGKDYYADADGKLLFGKYVIENIAWEFDEDTYEGKKINGVWVRTDGEEYANLYVDGVLQTAANADTNGIIIIDKDVYYIDPEKTENRLYKGDGIITVGGITYAFDGYVGLRLENVVFDDKYYNSEGKLVDSDANGELVTDSGDVYKYNDETGKLYDDFKGTGIYVEKLGKYCYFEGNVAKVLGSETYESTEDGKYYVDGAQVTAGIKTDFPVGDGVCEAYFDKDGKLASAEFAMNDGSIRVFEDGFRVSEEDMRPEAIIIITQIKNGRTIDKLGRVELYRFWNTDYEYIPYYNCYGYTITLNGVEVTAEAGEILKVVIEAGNRMPDNEPHVIVVTFDKETICHGEYVFDSVKIPATCKEGGVDIYKCSKCGSDDSAKEFATPKNEATHQWGEPVIIAATHTDMGTKTATCKVCDAKTVEYTPALPHDKWEVAEQKAPTCGTAGYIKYKSCSCEYKRSDEILPATGVHTYGEAVATADGYEFTCSGCQVKYYYVTPAPASSIEEE